MGLYECLGKAWEQRQCHHEVLELYGHPHEVWEQWQYHHEVVEQHGRPHEAWEQQ